MVHIDDKHSHYDGQSDKDHDEQQVLANQRDDLGWRWDDLLDDQKEDGEWDEHGRWQRDLLTFIRGKIEHQNGEEGQTQAGDNEEECIEERETLQDEGVGDEGVGEGTVMPAALGACSAQNFPLTIVEEVAAVHLVVYEN